MIDWVLEKIEKIARSIFHWTWRVQTQENEKEKSRWNMD